MAKMGGNWRETVGEWGNWGAMGCLGMAWGSTQGANHQWVSCPCRDSLLLASVEQQHSTVLHYKLFWSLVLAFTAAGQLSHFILCCHSILVMSHNTLITRKQSTDIAFSMGTV